MGEFEQDPNSGTTIRSTRKLGNYNFESITGLDELIDFLDSFCSNYMIPYCEYSEEYTQIINLSHEEILNLNAEQAYANAIKLQAYSIYLKKDLDKIKAQSLWCEDILNRMVGTHWKDFSDYMKYEPKRQAIIANDTFATKVHDLNQRLQMCIIQSESKIQNVENISRIMESLGKKRNYDNR